MDFATAKHHLNKTLGNNYSNAPVVYVLSQFKNKPAYKIGLSYNLKSRLGTYQTAFVNFYVYYCFITAIESVNDLENALHTHKNLEQHRLKFPKSIYKDKTDPSEWFMTSITQIDKAFHSLHIPIIMGYQFNNRNMVNMPLRHRLQLDHLPEFTRRGRRLKRQTHTILVNGKKYQVAVGDSVDSADPGEDSTKGIIYKMNRNQSCVLFSDGYSRCYTNNKIAEFVFH